MSRRVIIDRQKDREIFEKTADKVNVLNIRHSYRGGIRL